MEQLSVYEREVIRYGLRLMRPIRIADVKYCLQCRYGFSRKIINSLLDKKLIKPIGSGTKRYHEYELLPLSRELIMQAY
ncbi:hypothetical protein [Cohnella sp. WQ 127256]|uniref:hypothetical protein n=1 Tax=Cohnella sp. WQ 127256 TaxID=2938790 RepID=UPI0021194C70|nr:hypothetical protein [Cohnella sp. WQ 127256]